MNVTFFSPPGTFVVGEMFALRADENKCQVEFENYSLLHFCCRSSEGRKPLFTASCINVAPYLPATCCHYISKCQSSILVPMSYTNLQELKANVPPLCLFFILHMKISPINLSTITENNIFSLLFAASCKNYKFDLPLLDRQRVFGGCRTRRNTLLQLLLLLLMMMLLLMLCICDAMKGQAQKQVKAVCADRSDSLESDYS